MHCFGIQVNRPDVQSVVLRALLEDESVQALLHDRNLVCSTALTATVLLAFSMTCTWFGADQLQ